MQFLTKRIRDLKKVLISGANSFIGNALCKAMLRKGWQLRGTIRSENLMHNLPNGVNPVFIGSIGSNTEWGRATSNVDVVVHLAALVHKIRNDYKDPLVEYRYVNVNGTKYLARAAAANNIKRFVYLSTVKVNGEGRATPYNEKDNPEPMDPYGISKWEAEQVLHEIADMTGLEVVVLRPPLVYGSGVKANFLRLLEMVERGIPLPLANVNNRRSLIYLENLLDAIVTCINHPRAAGNTYLVSDGEDVSTPDLIRRMGSALGRPVRLFPFPTFMLKIAGCISGKSVAIDRLISSLTVDSSKIRRELNWQAPFSMAQGLRETAKWYLN